MCIEGQSCRASYRGARGGGGVGGGSEEGGLWREGGLRHWLHITGDNLEKHSTASLNGVGSFWGGGREGGCVGVGGVGGRSIVALGCPRAPPTSIRHHFLSVPPSFCCFGRRLFEFFEKYCECCCTENKGQRSEQRSPVVFSDLSYLVFFFFFLFSSSQVLSLSWSWY